MLEQVFLLTQAILLAIYLGIAIERRR